MVLLTVYIWPVRLRGLHKLPNVAQLAKQQSLNVSPVLSECFAVSKCPKLLPLAAIDYLLEFAQNHLHWIGDAIQPSHPLLLPSLPSLSLSHHWGLFQVFLYYVTCGWVVLGHFSSVQHCVTLWTVACQASLSMGFFRKEYWNELPWPPPGDLSDLGTEPTSLMSLGLAGGFFTTSATWKAWDYSHES